MSKDYYTRIIEKPVDHSSYLFLIIGPVQNYSNFLIAAPLVWQFLFILLNSYMIYKSNVKIKEIKTPFEGNESYIILTILVFRSVQFTLVLNVMLCAFRFYFFVLTNGFKDMSERYPNV